MLGFASLVLYALAGAIFALLVKARGCVQMLITACVAAAGMVLISGYILSSLSQIDSIVAWTICPFVACSILAAIAGLAGIRPWAKIHGAIRLLRRDANRFLNAYRNRDFFVRWCGAFLFVFVLAQFSVIWICCLPPENHDCHSCILPRMAHYIQQGNLNFYRSNYIAQTVHFKNATILQIYLYLATGSNESLVQFVSLGCSLLATLSVLGVAAMIWKNQVAALFAALVFGLLTINIMLAATAQVDMPITGFIGATVYFLGCFFYEKRNTWAALATVTAAIAFGIKASALLLVPGLAVIAFVGVFHVYRTSGFRSARIAASVVSISACLSFVVFMLPTGYYENMNRYGNFMGPEEWRQSHVLENLPLSQQFSVGTANAARYAIHFAGIDGIPSEIQSSLRLPLVFLCEAVGIDIFSNENVRQPFVIDSDMKAHPDRSYWGPAAYLLVLPATMLVLIRFRGSPFTLALIAAGVLYFLAQSYSSLYDPWRGRSFANLGVLLVPLIGCLFLKRVGQLRPAPQRFQKHVWIAVSTIILVAAVGASVTRIPTAVKHLLRSSDRITLLCRSNKQFEDRIRRYEAHVPPGSTVLLSRVSPIHNFALYGEKLNRKIVFKYARDSQATIDFKIFSELNDTPLTSDIPLDRESSPSGDGRWFLRKIADRMIAPRSIGTFGP